MDDLKTGDTTGAAAAEVVTRTVDVTTGTPLLREFYDEVLCEAFRPDELAGPYWETDEEPPRTVLALSPGGQVLGGVVGEDFPASGVLLISWVAVRRGLRGRGVGQRLMSHVASEWYGEPGQRLVLGELEDPRHWPSEDQPPVARLRFYDRFGVRALTTPYFQPALGPGKSAVYHMFLAVFDPHSAAVRRDAHGPAAVDGGVVRAFLAEYLAGSAEWCGRPDGSLDADGQWLLSCYDGTDIPLVPLLDYERIADPAPPGSTSSG
jgi:GNAT superfamily N-acetyltransferase